MAQVNTVLGPIKANELGTTSMHEHIQFGQPGWDQDPWVEYDRAAEFEKIKNDLIDFKAAGGVTLVDCSGMASGRDVPFYQNLSRASKVNIIACTGFWALNGIPGHLLNKDVDFFTELFVRELTRGMIEGEMRWGTAKAGFIKVAIDSFAKTPAPIEEATFRGAARASKRTGAAIITHGITHAYRQMEIFKEEGQDPSRVIVAHADATYAIDLERDKEICRWGAYVGYDHIGYEPGTAPPTARYAMPDERRVELVKTMIEAGFVKQLNISCDTNGRSFGHVSPKHTFSHLLRRFVPMLLKAGISEKHIHTMLAETPKKILPF